MDVQIDFRVDAFRCRIQRRADKIYFREQRERKMLGILTQSLELSSLRDPTSRFMQREILGCGDPGK